MENLVTTLKESINRNDLHRVGSARFLVNQRYNNNMFYCQCDGNGKKATAVAYDMEFNEIGRVENSNQPLKAVAKGVVQQYYYEVFNYLDVNRIHFLSSAQPDDKYCDGFEKLKSGIFINLQKVNMTYSGLQLNINIFGNYPKIDSFTISNSNSFTGTLESMLSGMVSKGRNSGSLAMALNGVVTLNGSASDANSVEFNATGCVVKKGSTVQATYANGTWTYA